MQARIIYRVHAIARMFKRGISEEEVRITLESGEIIESYPDDTPFPSYLILGWPAGRPIHVVAANSQQDNEIIIITVYEPDPAVWDMDFKRRR